MKRVAIVVLLLAAAGVGFWLWKGRGGTPATSTVTQQGSTATGSASSASSGTSSSARDEEGTANLVVTVTSAEGPIANANVRLAPDDGEVIVVETDDKGVARADKLAVGDWRISASAAGFVAKALESKTLEKDETVNVALTLDKGGALLKGTVTDVSGGPVVGARIDAAKLAGLMRPEDAVATVMTDKDGKYQLAVPVGHMFVAAASADYAPQSKTVEVGANGATVDFALVPGGVVEGIVRDANTKQPVAGATVTARRDAGGRTVLAEATRKRITSGADGKFKLAGLSPGAYELTARAGKLATKSPVIVGLGVAEQVSDVELLLASGLGISGVVLNEKNEPVPEIEVDAGGRGVDGANATTNAKGEFSFGGLPPGHYHVSASNETYLSDGSAKVELVDKDATGVTVKVKTGIKITGHVEPRQICTVDYDLDRTKIPEHIYTPVTGVTTTANGDFSIGPAGADAAVLTAHCSSGDKGSLSVAPNATTNLTLNVEAGASISGRLVDTKGAPMVGATVMAALDGNDRRFTIVNGMVTSGVQALTNANGEYTVAGLEAGPYRLDALDAGRLLRPKTVVRVTLAEKEKKTGVDLIVDRMDGVISGVVNGPDGKPLADAWVSAHQDEQAMIDDLVERDSGDHNGSLSISRTSDSEAGGIGELAPVLTDAAGRFTLTNLAHGKFEVVAEAQAGSIRGRAENVVPNATITIQAQGITTLSGTVHGATGPAAVFDVELEGPTSTVRTFTDGTFELVRVDPGDYTVRVTSSVGNAEQKVKVAPNQKTTIDVALAANAIVTGKVVDVDGKPMPNLGVVVIADQGPGGASIRLDGPPPQTGPDGSFRVESKAQTSMFVVMTPGSPTIRRPLTLVAGQTLDLGTVKLDPPRPPPN